MPIDSIWLYYTNWLPTTSLAPVHLIDFLLHQLIVDMEKHILFYAAKICAKIIPPDKTCLKCI